MSDDFRKYFFLETYNLDEVKSHFTEQGYLNAFDFFCIVIWKANRAKSNIAKKLLKNDFDNLDDAVKELTRGISAKPEYKDKLEYLIDQRKFHLPMATAILTVLYPDYFTVYDVRVCDSLGDFHKLGNLVNFNNIWDGYLQYKQKVEEVIIDGCISPSLRDKDRYLWGKSLKEQLEKDIKECFVKDDDADGV